MQRITIDFAVHSDGADAHLFACPDDPTRNLAAIGDQDLAKASYAVSHTIADRRFPIAKFRFLLNRQLPIDNRKCLSSDSKKRLPVLDGLTVLDINLDNFTGGFRLNLVHQLHRFDNTDDGFRLDLAADAHEAFCCR